MTAAAVEALLPVRGFTTPKERLSAILTPDERAHLARAMFTDVLKALQRTTAIVRIWVVSPDRDVLQLAREAGVGQIVEPPTAVGLNGALEAARSHILAAEPSVAGLLVVPTDVPAADPAGFEQFLEGAGRGPLVRVCPSPDNGTNALLLRPPDVIPFAFGPSSAAEHRRRAGRADVRFEIRRVAALAIDIDRPEDLVTIGNEGCGPATSALLARFDVGARLARRDR